MAGLYKTLDPSSSRSGNTSSSSESYTGRQRAAGAAKEAKAAKAAKGTTPKSSGQTTRNNRARYTPNNKGNSAANLTGREAYLEALRTASANKSAEEAERDRVARNRRAQQPSRYGGRDELNKGRKPVVAEKDKANQSEYTRTVQKTITDMGKPTTFQAATRQTWDALNAPKDLKALDSGTTRALGLDRAPGVFGGPQRVKIIRDFDEPAPVARQMTWEEYNALDADGRAAVDANTMLSDAIAKDTALIQTLDADKNGYVSWSEGSGNYGKGGVESYRANYDRVFNRELPDDRTTVSRRGRPDQREIYAPNTLAVLNTLGINDRYGEIEDYLGGHAYITDEDIKAGANKRKDGAAFKPADENERTTLGIRLTEGMRDLTRSFDEGKAVVGKEQIALDLADKSATEFSAFVSTLRNEMALGKSFDNLTSFGDDNAASSRVDLSSLVDRDYSERRGWLDTLYSNIQSNPADADKVTSKEFMSPWLESYGSTWDEWQRLLSNKGVYEPERAYRSSADKLEEAGAQAQAKVEQIMLSGGSISDEEYSRMVEEIALQLSAADYEDEDKEK